MSSRPYETKRTAQRHASTSSSLVSCANFANRTVSRLDLVEQDYTEWHAIQANRERLLEYKSELVKINSKLLDMDCREAHLAATLARKSRTIDANTTSRRQDVTPTLKRTQHAHPIPRRPIFMVASRKKPVLVNSSSQPHVRSSHASFQEVKELPDLQPATPYACSITASDTEQPKTSSAQDSQLIKQLRSTQFSLYMKKMIDVRVAHAVDARIDSLTEERKRLLCTPVPDPTRIDAATTSTEQQSCRGVMDDSRPEATVDIAIETQAEVAEVGLQTEVEVDQLDTDASSEAVVEQKIVTEQTVKQDLVKTTLDDANEESAQANTEMINSATQTRYSSFAPSHVKQRKLAVTVEKHKVYQAPATPTISHDELARLAQRLSSPSLLSQESNRPMQSNDRFHSRGNICYCENVKQHAQNCPSNTSLSLPTFHKAHAVRVHKPSPLSLEYKHLVSAPTYPVSQKNNPWPESNASERSGIRRTKQDSSVSLGIRMQSGHAFDNAEKFKSIPLGVRAKQGRGKLRKMLFGI